MTGPVAGGSAPAARRRTVVKVCGLTRLQDAHDARRAGADWLGFVVHGDSPRRIRPESMSNILTTLPGATGVAVLVGVGPDEALALARRADARRVQLHRVDPADWPADFPLPAAFAVPMTAEGSLAAPLPPAPHLTLLDAADPRRAGGTGRRLPWPAARAIAAGRAVMLAGGLDGECVEEALEAVRPWGVDASSGLESAPGIKDPVRVEAYVAAVRRWDARANDGS
jgi:phosphoribosylanthranilate isomerase